MHDNRIDLPVAFLLLTSTMSTITDITTQSQWDETLSAVPSSTLLVVSFHAPWAAPCAQMATVLSTLASEYPVSEPLSTKWVSINAEELSDISEAYDVTAVPFLVLVRNGQVIETVSGSSAVKVRTAIETHTQKDASAPTASSSINGTNQTNAPVAKTDEANVDPEKQKEELFKRLGDLVKAAPVMLFMKGTPSDPQCGFSRQLVGILRENSVKYGFFNILADDEVRQGLKEFAEWPTYPQLWVDGELVGGLDIVSDISEAKLGLGSVVILDPVLTYGLRSRKKWATMRTSSSHTAFLELLMPPLEELNEQTGGAPDRMPAKSLLWL